VDEMIKVVREEGTDYLFAGFLERELAKHDSIDAVVAVEPKRGDNYISQDYFYSIKDHPFKYVFYALPSVGEEYKRELGDNCSLLTYAADPEFHKPMDVVKKYNVGFIGRGYYKDREDYLKVIAHFWPNSFFNSYGTPGIEIPERYSECGVLFNHTRPEIDVNLRFFEEMALGCQVMLRNKILDQFAVEGEHYLAYSSPEELVEVIKRLLADDDLRLKIAHQARKHFLKHHTYTHRAKSVIKHLTEYYENSGNR
jgi:spore maturation protein CgeB